MCKLIVTVSERWQAKALANNNKQNNININSQILQQILMAPVAVAAALGSLPTTTNSLQDMSAAAAATALDMKPKGELAAVPAAAAQKPKKCA